MGINAAASFLRIRISVDCHKLPRCSAVGLGKILERGIHAEEWVVVVAMKGMVVNKTPSQKGAIFYLDLMINNYEAFRDLDNTAVIANTAIYQLQ